MASGGVGAPLSRRAAVFPDERDHLIGGEPGLYRNPFGANVVKAPEPGQESDV